MKNTFKKPTITYEPIQQPKEPLWMHSVEKPKHKGIGTGDILIVLFIFAMLYFAWLIFS